MNQLICPYRDTLFNLLMQRGEYLYSFYHLLLLYLPFIILLCISSLLIIRSTKVRHPYRVYGKNKNHWIVFSRFRERYGPRCWPSRSLSSEQPWWWPSTNNGPSSKQVCCVMLCLLRCDGRYCTACVLHCTAHVLYCTVLYMWYTLMCCTVLYCTVLYCTCDVLCCVVLYSTVFYVLCWMTNLHLPIHLPARPIIHLLWYGPTFLLSCHPSLPHSYSLIFHSSLTSVTTIKLKRDEDLSHQRTAHHRHVR